MEFYLTVKEAWNAMYEDCRHAVHSIDLEQYILNDDALGKRFMRLLAQKAAQGVRVRIILDAVGSHTVRDSPEVDAIRKCGGEVLFYRPLWWIELLLPSRWFPRSHCKLMIIDGGIAYVGGVCMAEYMREWRDTQMRLTEPLVHAIARDFSCFHARLKGDREGAASPRLDTGTAPLQYAIQHPRARLNLIYRSLLEELDKAEYYACFATPYFFPPRRLRAAMRRAQARGVEVTVLLSGKTDVPSADLALRALLPGFLRDGFRVLFYSGRVMHAKYAVIDDCWATVGSNNFDRLSLLRNREANIILRNPGLVAEVRGHFLEDRQHAVVATIDDWRTQNLYQKCVGLFGRALHRVV